jgi:hypothetical protein
MKPILRISAAATALTALLAAATFPAHAAEECKIFSAAGEHLLADWAPLMAKQGAVNVAEGRGYSVVGEAEVVKCQPGGTWGNECYARVKACKRVN